MKKKDNISAIIFPNSMYVDAMGAASVFLLGGDNATIRLYILSIMFGVLYNFYHRKKYKIPVFAIFNLILFAFLRDIATAKLMAVIIVAFLLILEVKDKTRRKTLTVPRKLIANIRFAIEF